MGEHQWQETLRPGENLDQARYCLEEEKDLGYYNPSDTLGRDAAWELWLSDKGVRNAMTKKTNMSPDKLVMQTHARRERWRDRRKRLWSRMLT